MTYNLIEQLLMFCGFEKRDNNFHKCITIRTPDQIMIVNGRRMTIPGKIGDIDLDFMIFDDCGEVVDDAIINIPCVYCKASFKGVEFLKDHIMYPEEDVVIEIKNFLRNFNMV